MVDLRVGTVSAVDAASLSARVRFEVDDVTSWWLKVLQTPPTVAASGTFFDEEKGEDQDVTVKVEVAAWFPVVGETVLCIYGEGFNSDGYIIGGLR